MEQDLIDLTTAYARIRSVARRIESAALHATSVDVNGHKAKLVDGQSMLKASSRLQSAAEVIEGVLERLEKVDP